jgi:glycosyltransferase involved in cell wall biosynthesis
MATRPKILYLIDGLGMGGAENLMTSYLQHLDTSFFEPYVCALQVRDGNPIGVKLEEMGIPVDLLPVDHLRDLTALPRLIRYMRGRKIDLIHTQLEFATTFGNLASKILRIPSVCTLHTLSDPEKGSKERRRLVVMWWILRHFCDRVIAVSEETRQIHLRVSGNSPEKVITLYNGIEVDAFHDLEKEQAIHLVEQLGIPASGKILTTIAVLRPPKGIQHLIDAMPAILEAIPDAYYLIVGDGEHRAELEARAKSNKVNDHVIFAGYRSDIANLMAISHIFVLPTLGDALPTVIAEAMAASKPVIASAIGGVPEMVSDGKSGILLPAGDSQKLAEACIQLLQKTEEAEAMGKYGRQVALERFNIAEQVKKTEAIYKDLLVKYGK